MKNLRNKLLKWIAKKLGANFYFSNPHSQYKLENHKTYQTKRLVSTTIFSKSDEKFDEQAENLMVEDLTKEAINNNLVKITKSDYDNLSYKMTGEIYVLDINNPK